MSVISSSEHDGIVTITHDDGAKNAYDTGVFADLIAAFDDAGAARAVVYAGRDGIFSAGLNVKKMAGMDRGELHHLLSNFGEALMRIWTHPSPVVAAVTGHAVAAGTMFSMTADHAVAAEGPYAWGLTETQINFPMPQYGLALCQHNVRNDRIDDLILPGAKVDAATALEVGYCDELVPIEQVLSRAAEKAAELGALPPKAYADTKRRLRQATAERVLAGNDADIELMLDAVAP